jgi:hypothetical protein
MNAHHIAKSRSSISTWWLARLVSTPPSNAHRPEDEAVERAGFQRFARLDHRDVEAVLLEDKQLDASFVISPDHIVDILSRNAIGFSTMACLPAFAQAMTSLGMHFARRQNRHRVDILPRQKVIDIVDRGNPKFGCDGVGTRTDGVADRGQTGPVDMAVPQQVGMTPRDTSASLTTTNRSIMAISSHIVHASTKVPIVFDE